MSDASEMLAGSRTLTVYGPPFDEASADIAIRSSDQIEFRVHKLILTHASPVLQTLFGLPQAEADALAGQEGRLPVVPVPQDAETLADFLRFCYPMMPPRPRSMDKLVALINAAQYYQVDEFTSYLQEILLSAEFLPQNSNRAYALACRWDWKNVAEKAAKSSLRVELDLRSLADIPEMADMPAVSLIRLLDYRNRCIEAASGKLGIEGMIWVEEGQFWPMVGPTTQQYTEIPGCHCQWGAQLSPTVLVKQWLADYLKEAQGWLKMTPSRESLESKGVPYSYIRRTAGCFKCSTEIDQEMSRFIEAIGEQVEGAINAVSIDSEIG
jgi:hypothetical protein